MDREAINRITGSSKNYALFASAQIWEIGAITNPITNYIADGYLFFGWNLNNCPVCGCDHE